MPALLLGERPRRMSGLMIVKQLLSSSSLVLERMKCTVEGQLCYGESGSYGCDVLEVSACE
jgi:hypothetical protein